MPLSATECHPSSLQVIDVPDSEFGVHCGSFYTGTINNTSGQHVQIYFEDDGTAYWFKKRTVASWMRYDAYGLNGKKADSKASGAASGSDVGAKAPTASSSGGAALVAEVVAVPAEEPAEEEEEPTAAAETAAAEAAAAEAVASMEGSRPLTADEARATAAAEGLELVPSRSKTGFKNVSKCVSKKNGCKYQVQIRENGSYRYLGIFATPEEAALCYARHVGAERAVSEASEARIPVTKPLTADEARAVAAAEGLELVPSSRSESGFKGVCNKPGGKYWVRICENGSYRYLGIFTTPEEAALCYARYVGAERAAAEAALRYARYVGPEQAVAEALVARNADPHLPLTADEAKAAAAAEGLELVPSSRSETGFKGVSKNRGKYLVAIHQNGSMLNLGIFATPEAAALRYARYVGAERAAAEAALYYARHVGAERAAAEAAVVVESTMAPAMRSAEALQVATDLRFPEEDSEVLPLGEEEEPTVAEAAAAEAVAAEAAAAEAAAAEAAAAETAAAEAAAAEAAAAETAAAEAAAAETAASMEGSRPLTADEARAAATAEGLELVPSSRGMTGFKGVSKNRGRYLVHIQENGTTRYLGSFATPEEAALCYARRAGAARAAIEAAEARIAATLQPLTEDEARAAATAEGLELVPSSHGMTGFKGVSMNRGRYLVQIQENGQTRHLGTFATPEEAALCYARRAGAARAAIEAAEARIAATLQPLTADEARAAATAEGLELVPSSRSKTGFKGVRKKHCDMKYNVQIQENGTTRYLGSFATPEEAALCYARRAGAARAAIEAAEARIAATLQPLTADEARATAAAEGLVLVSSSNGSGFEGVQKQSGKYRVQIQGIPRQTQTRYLGFFATPEEAALHFARHLGPERAAAAAAAASAKVVGWNRGDRKRRLQQEYRMSLMQPPKPRPAGVAAAAAVRAVLGVEALAGHAFAVGSWIEVRDLRQGNRHITQFERVRVYASDDLRAVRVELAGELSWIDLDDWDVLPAPALPPDPIEFGEAYTGQMPTDAAAYASHLSPAFVGMDCTAYATWTVGGAASTPTSPPAPAAPAALPAVRFDRAQLDDATAAWLDAVLANQHARGRDWQRSVLDSKLFGCDVRTRLRPGMQGLENFTRWGGPLPPVGLRIQIERQQARLLRGAATVIAQVVHQRGLVPWRGGELERRLQLAEWPVGVEPPPPLPPLRLQLDVRPGGTWGNPWAYSIDRNWAIRGSCCTYDVGTFHVVPLIWNTCAGLDQDKVFQIVYTRARWEADETARRAHVHTARATALTSAKSELRSMLIKRLCAFGRALHLDLKWALDQYERQEGACYYTGVTLILRGPVYTTPFILSFERLDESLGYTRTNTVFIAAEFNSGYGVQMSADLADRFFGPKRERERGRFRQLLGLPPTTRS